CAKLYNFPASGSMGCHRLAAEEEEEKKKKKKKKKKRNNNNANGYNRCHRTSGAWPLITPTDTIGATAPLVLGP
ncbi:hypothetical protein M9458_051955, partial [Cirrhinus mrigala]